LQIGPKTTITRSSGAQKFLWAKRLSDCHKKSRPCARPWALPWFWTPSGPALGFALVLDPESGRPGPAEVAMVLSQMPAKRVS